jgi:pyruvate dehydrogenase E1 component alpha subunit
MSDPGLSYRSREEVQKVRELKDPINFVKKTILDYNVATENDLKEIEKNIRNEVNEAIDKCRACDLPNYEDTYRDIYIDNENRIY